MAKSNGSARGGPSSPARRAARALHSTAPRSGGAAAARSARATRAARARPAAARRPARESEVAELQRAKMLTAMAQICRERGAAGASVADVADRSHVSRRTFYEMFAGREECFMATLEEAIARAEAAVLPTYEAQERWPERMRAGVVALLRFLEADPTFAGVLIVHVLGAGERALARRAEVLSALLRAIDGGRALSRSPESIGPLAAEGAAGAVLSVLHSRLTVGAPGIRPARRRREPLVALAPELTAIVLAPYLGAPAARRELARPAPAPAAAAGRRTESDALVTLELRLTHRTIRVLAAVGEIEGASNREIADKSGIADQGQTSKLLARLETHKLIRNAGDRGATGRPNAWTLTPYGAEVVAAIRRETTGRL